MPFLLRIDSMQIFQAVFQRSGQSSGILLSHSHTCQALNTASSLSMCADLAYSVYRPQLAHAQLARALHNVRDTLKHTESACHGIG